MGRRREDTGRLATGRLWPWVVTPIPVTSPFTVNHDTCAEGRLRPWEERVSSRVLVAPRAPRHSLVSPATRSPSFPPGMSCLPPAPTRTRLRNARKGPGTAACHAPPRLPDAASRDCCSQRLSPRPEARRCICPSACLRNARCARRRGACPAPPARSPRSPRRRLRQKRYETGKRAGAEVAPGHRGRRHRGGGPLVHGLGGASGAK